MREIKFRVWLYETKKMEIVKIMEWAGIANTPFIKNVDVSGGAKYIRTYSKEYSGAKKDTFALMQYTGLKDENGKEIYEGDILNMTYHGGVTVVKPEIKGVVSFYRASFVAGKEKIPFDRIGRSLEVIGNIYENPELLESEK